MEQGVGTFRNERLDTKLETRTEWIETEEEEELPVEYTITSTPNDFNVKTLFDVIESGAIRLPGFQRNYVWPIKKASRLIESLIMGLPVPQLFFYQKGRNNFLVIDGQQRLMSIYYFIKGKFPADDKRAELRRILDERGDIPSDLFNNTEYFGPFALRLGEHYTGEQNRLDKLSYAMLDKDDRDNLDFRPIRCVVITQHDPKDEDSSMYEIFYRLNTGGENLTPQEIRRSLFYSEFYSMLSKINLEDRWRRLTRPEPDLHMRDVEILLRGFAMLTNASKYKPPMIKFLNIFSDEARKYSEEKRTYYQSLFSAFLDTCSGLPDQAFTSQFGRFSTSMFEAIFVASCEDAFSRGSLAVKPLHPDKLSALKLDGDFLRASQSQTTSPANVKLRLNRARQILFS